MVGNCACPEFCQFLDHNDPLCMECALWSTKDAFECSKCHNVVLFSRDTQPQWRERYYRANKMKIEIGLVPVCRECVAKEREVEKGA